MRQLRELLYIYNASWVCAKITAASHGIFKTDPFQAGAKYKRLLFVCGCCFFFFRLTCVNILAFTFSSGLGKTAQISLRGMRGLWEKWSISSSGLYRPLHGGSSVQEEPLRAAGIIAGTQPWPPSKGFPRLCSFRAALWPSITRVHEHANSTICILVGFLREMFLC